MLRVAAHAKHLVHLVDQAPREIDAPHAEPGVHGKGVRPEIAPLPIGEGQTIAQPYIVAYMIDALELEGGERVLEIGTGSGYAAAVLSRIARDVYTIERHPSLAREARAALERLGYDNVHVIEG